MHRLINFIVLHTAGAYNRKTGRAVHQSVEDIDRYHREHNGWRKIGYHWFVDGQGVGWRGRQDEEIGAHASGFNQHTLGLCVSGHGDYLPWTDAQTNEVVGKCAAWCAEYGIPPENVIGHAETDEHGGPPVFKTCPGLLIDMKRIRELVRERLERGP